MVDGKCVWRHFCSVVGSYGDLNRVFVFVLWYLVHRLVELKCDVVYNDVLMDSGQDCIFLVSDEHEIIFGDIDHEANKLHVCSFGSALYNYGSDDFIDENVVRLKWCCTLDVAYFM